jgi:anti-sigma factor RsiW
MTRITRNVVLDLLPLYVADEVSADTRVLVEEYLEADPELASIAEESAAMELSSDIPVPLTKEDQMRAYREAKRIMLLRTVVLAAVIAVILSLVFALIVFAPVVFIYLNR